MYNSVQLKFELYFKKGKEILYIIIIIIMANSPRKNML